ncbi:MAG: ADP-glyceromanno-heptose 6-epimerase [Marinilabiliales bacterium]|nr:MAG: ADP-glyceromanno-heptose 6-epimerase [Marinilabiliales bacterium]
MIVLTGAAGFIGSVLLKELNNKGINDIVISDDFSDIEKNRNFENKSFIDKVHRNELATWLDENSNRVDFIIHIGARTDTTEFDKSVFDMLNLNYTKNIWEKCTLYNIPLIYASSAATYGLGEYGYIDSHDVVENLKPLNPYGESKNDFDKWALKQDKKPPFWAGLKFFNVYGPNEYHKGRMASVILHAYKQINETGGMKLFRSHNPEFKDGEQLRDFVYVKDVVNVIQFLMENKPESGLYNLGTGKARTFIDLVKATFEAMGMPSQITFIDTPEDIRDKYQYFTEADMSKLKDAGYSKEFTSLEEGVNDYVVNYLSSGKYH